MTATTLSFFLISLLPYGFAADTHRSATQSAVRDAQRQGAKEKICMQFVGPKDQRLARSILCSWKHDPWVPEHKLSVRVAEGVATLSGRVENLLSKERAEHAARVSGSSKVLSHIQVVAQSRRPNRATSGPRMAHR